MLANTGNGVVVLAKKGNRLMAENSKGSAQPGRRSTSKTKGLTPDQSLEILQAAIHKCRDCGIDIKVSPFFGQEGPTVVIILAGVEIHDKYLRLADG